MKIKINGMTMCQIDDLISQNPHLKFEVHFERRGINYVYLIIDEVKKI